MFDRWTQYSYTAQKHQRNRIFRYLFVFLILYIVYNCLCTFFFSVWVVDNETMKPTLHRKDRIIFTSFLPPWGRNSEENNYLFKRGSIVIVDMNHYKDKKLPLRLIDGIVRFSTAQNVSIFSGEGQYYIKRVIALPGDEVSMKDYEFRVKAAGSSYSLTEYELSQKPYHPAKPASPPNWDSSVPFSGNMDTIILGPDECFVVSDDRGNTNDSRTWGVISSSSITAKAIVRFWPLNKINLL